MTSARERAADFSEQKLTELREALSKTAHHSQCVVTSGSYARREASPLSDIDFYVIRCNNETDEGLSAQVEEAIKSIVAVEPSPDGAFGRSKSRSTFLQNIGGDEDTNPTLTRRMLILLEGEWLFNEDAFVSLRREIIERYVSATPKDHQIALFLLNDIVRYWRTMTVDYMYKTSEAEKPKPWAIRNIKLVFSRKLMYASGLFCCGLTADKSLADKINILEELLQMPVIERMQFICGASFDEALSHYCFFLEQIESADVRQALETVDKNSPEDETYRRIKNRGHLFTRALLQAFETKFHSTHPIHRAIIF